MAGETLLLRATKGSELTIAEMDGNLTYLSHIMSGSTNHVTGAMSVWGNILPNADETYDLGSNSLKWNNIFCGFLSASEADFGTLSISGSTVTISGSLVVTGSVIGNTLEETLQEGNSADSIAILVSSSMYLKEDSSYLYFKSDAGQGIYYDNNANTISGYPSNWGLSPSGTVLYQINDLNSLNSLLYLEERGDIVILPSMGQGNLRISSSLINNTGSFSNKGISRFDGKLTITNNNVLESENGFGQLDLRNGADNTVLISTDSGSFNQSWTLWNSNRVYNAVGPTASTGAGIVIQKDAASDSDGWDTIYIKSNDTNSATSTNINKHAIIIGSQNSTINPGVYNSAILGGSGMTLTHGNTVLISNLKVNGDVSSSLTPNITETYNLGSLSKRWNEIHALRMDLSGSSTITGSLHIDNLQGTGSLQLEVAGRFEAAQKSFKIQHPTKEDHYLIHGALEGPENGVYVRGILEKADKPVINLPEYWPSLIDMETITLHLTPLGSYQQLYGGIEKENNRVLIGGKTGRVSYIIYGERKDMGKLEVERLKW